jgi:hypothetical protein
MTTATIYDIPKTDADRIQEAVLNKIREMDAAELKISRDAHSSLAAFLTQIAYEVSRLLGYVVAIPIAWAQNVIESTSMGLEDGFAAGLRNQRVTPHRRR